MGAWTSRFISYINPNKECRILMVGLDSAGKSTLLYQFKLGEAVQTIPTIGFNVETVTYNKLHMTIWDVGGQGRIRPLWKHYFNGTNAFIFVVDANDSDRVIEAAAELEACLRDEALRTVPVLIFANKADLPASMSVSDLTRAMELPQLLGTRKWLVQQSVATSGKGLHEGLNWLSSAIAP